MSNLKKTTIPVVSAGLAAFSAVSAGSTANADILYSQLDFASNNGSPDQNFEASFDAYDSEGADDFVIPLGETWNIDQVFIVGTTTVPGGNPTTNISFYADDSGRPADIPLFTFSDLVPVNVVGGSLTSNVNATLSAGTYWVSHQTNQDFNTSGQHFWSNRTEQTGNLSVWRNPGNGFGTGATDWTPQTTAGVGGGTNPDYLFELRGTMVSNAVPEPGSIISAFILACILIPALAWKRLRTQPEADAHN